ncbi:MAG: O-acetyl-ADP-ribose deacetylase [Magnetococcales bacterium]|nr:O-acetyl-ADP-ribose deacetylase [Magnetococcales bacterium]
MGTLEIQTGDITLLEVDVIVNAANASLLGGGGVDGAIHRKGGPTILHACQELRKNKYPEGLPTGAVALTPGGMLPARHVIHTVGPIYHQDREPHRHLADCYRNALTLAAEIGAKRIAFPGISTGVYGFPKKEAATIAIQSVQEFFRGNPRQLSRVILCAFSEDDAHILREARARFLDDHHG